MRLYQGGALDQPLELGDGYQADIDAEGNVKEPVRARSVYPDSRVRRWDIDNVRITVK